jgi:hypothetical protein
VTTPRYIGGFFELDLPRGGAPLHPDALALSTGRACLAAILDHVKPRKVHLPFYVCDAVLVPMADAGAPFEFYALDDRLQPVELPPPDDGELVIAINYFGLQTPLIEELAKRYGRNLIVDNVQAFFEPARPDRWSFYSARKHFGVPDGAYLYAPEELAVRAQPNPRSDIRHLVNRLIGRQQTAYRQVRRYERSIDGRIRGISPLSERLLAAMDYEEARDRRKQNYRLLHDRLGDRNRFDAALPDTATPFCYPLLPERPVDRAVVARERLYIPTLWEDVTERAGHTGFDFERDFASRMLPLPVDHRYTPDDMAEAVRRLEKAVTL